METKDVIYLALYAIQMFFIIGLFFYQKTKLSLLEKYTQIVDIDKIKRYADIREETIIMQAHKYVNDEASPLIDTISDAMRKIYEKKSEALLQMHQELVNVILYEYEISKDKDKDETYKRAFPKNYNFMMEILEEAGSMDDDTEVKSEGKV